jgi:hypothetical protein
MKRIPIEIREQWAAHHMAIDKIARDHGRKYWGPRKHLPRGAQLLGVVWNHDEYGALIRTADGRLCRGRAGVLYRLDQRHAKAVWRWHEAHP